MTILPCDRKYGQHESTWPTFPIGPAKLIRSDIGPALCALSLSHTHTHTLSLSLSLSLFSTQTNNILRNVVTIEPPRGCIDSWETLVEGRSIKKWEREVFANTKCLILCRRNSIIIFSEFYRNVTTVHIWYDVSERLNIKSYKDI